MEVEKDVQISFTAPDLSSNGGLLLAAKAEKATGIVTQLSRCIRDWRNQRLVEHSIEEQMRQRVLQIAAGYEDADDCDALRHDSVLKELREIAVG